MAVLEIIKLLQEKGADVAFHDPHCKVIADDGHNDIKHLPMPSMPLNKSVLDMADLVLLVTDHTSVDYQFVANKSRLIFDTRGAVRGFTGKARIVALSGAVEHPGAKSDASKRAWASIWKHLGMAHSAMDL